MPRRICLIAALSILGANDANAESNVTLYGIVDAGVGYVSNAAVVTQTGTPGKPAQAGGSAVTFNNGTWNGNRWGLKGSEDLGDGVQAIFRLENGFNIGTGALGQGGAEFGRHAYVGFVDARHGTLTIGRQYDPLTDMVGTLGANFILGSVAAHPGDVDNFDHSSRANNSLKYQSPDFAGWTIEALYALGGQAGNVTQDNAVGAGLRYRGSGLVWAMAYTHANNQKSGSTDNTLGSWASTSDSGFGSSVNVGYASARARDTFATSATYEIGALRAGTNFSRTTYTPGIYSVFKRAAKFDSAGVFAMVNFTTAFRTGAGYSYVHVNAPGDNASSAQLC